MKHSEKFARVQRYYEHNQWILQMVHDAVGKLWITAEEYQEITGDEYTEG